MSPSLFFFLASNETRACLCHLAPVSGSVIDSFRLEIARDSKQRDESRSCRTYVVGYLTATRRVVDVRMARISNLFIMDFDIGSSRKTRGTHHGISSLLIETGLTKHPKVLKEK